MGSLIRMIFGVILSAFIARIVEGLFFPTRSRGTLGAEDAKKEAARSKATLDLKPCPVCGVYTAQPATHCKP